MTGLCGTEKLGEQPTGWRSAVWGWVRRSRISTLQPVLVEASMHFSMLMGTAASHWTRGERLWIQIDAAVRKCVPGQTGHPDGLGTRLQVPAFEGDIGIQGTLLLCVLVCSCVCARAHYVPADKRK